MAFDLWTYQFCLACDKQVQSDAATYCSEPCQMIDSERATLPPSSQVSSPGFPPPPTEICLLGVWPKYRTILRDYGSEKALDPLYDARY
ncbi:hypothetical protein Forpe1208_v015559 [Fusarium oxysporum f. sp. rapae]|uniref:Uncharacterized protein n=1 Tax=Fusarium oxysporum f. sp. rapae TaxID=485398 RepID=A0A8J5NE97_FUSOX|nr:hypothetical protein Forpe1208_v015559 [Fusarium oxysporum f. sp. rapae]